jgi:hypothetical protein
MKREVATRCSGGYPYLQEAELSAHQTATSSRRFLSSPWIRHPSVVDGSGIARSSIAAAARFWPTPLEAGGSLALASSAMRCWTSWADDALLRLVLGLPTLPDVLPELHKLSCFLVEPDLHLADLLELCVLTPAGTGTIASSRRMSTRGTGLGGSPSSGIPRWLPSSRPPRSTWKHSRLGPQSSSPRLWLPSEQSERQ